MAGLILTEVNMIEAHKSTMYFNGVKIPTIAEAMSANTQAKEIVSAAIKRMMQS